MDMCYWKLGVRLFSENRRTLFAKWCLLKSCPHPLTETESWGSSLMITFQMNGSQILEKDSPGYKTEKRLGEDLHVKETVKALTTGHFQKQMLQEKGSEVHRVRKNVL